MAYLSGTDLALLALEQGGPSMNQYLKDRIRKHDTTDMTDGADYYRGHNKIKERTLYYYRDGQKYTDETKENVRLAHPWLRTLIDQKVSYLFGNPLTFHSETLDLNAIIGDDFDDSMIELAKEASIKGTAFLHIYLENGAFKYKVVPAEEIIPTYDENGLLTEVIHYYKVMSSEGPITKAEVWDREGVTYYLEDNGRFLEEQVGVTPDGLPVARRGHILYQRGAEVFETGWGMVPFIEFRNNAERLGDLAPIKTLIDEYDEVRSDLAIALKEIQQAVYVLTNYNNQDPQELLRNMKYDKVVKLTDNGDLKTITVDIPIAATEKHLNDLKKDIMRFGQGVDTDSDAFIGTQVSGIALRFLYEGLNQKCKKMERKFTPALRTFLAFIGQYLAFMGQPSISLSDVTISFNYALIAIDSEQMQIIKESRELLSLVSLLSMHPKVQDVELELQRLQAEGRLLLNADGTITMGSSPPIGTDE